MSDKKKWYSKVEFWVYIICIVFLLIGIYSAYLYFEYFSGQVSKSQAVWGLFGDYIGGVLGVLLSLIAVLLIFLTYSLQKRELTDTKKALNVQNEQLELQQYQSLFFKLLERKDNVINIFTFVTTSELEAINDLYRLARQSLNEFETDGNKNRLINRWNSYKSNSLLYINTIVSLIIFTDKIPEKNNRYSTLKNDLVDILSASISPIEANLVNCIFEYYLVLELEDDKIQNCKKVISELKLFVLTDKNKIRL